MGDKKLHQAVSLFGDVLLAGTELVRKEVSLDSLQNLSNEQTDLLNILKKKGASSPGNLAVLQGVHKSAISNRLTKLMKKGLVEWENPPATADKRSKLVKLSAEGEKVIKEIDEAVYHIIENLLNDVEEEKIDNFMDILLIVKEKLNEKGDSGE
ncbi:MarR family winged helix-turn-helix transcriptional regulator [Sediminibacillus massiliensis]|uniref:MarR family winged helix-turn-helix transcriptional regulator n=1 Tax=Sediminibacillus massiliensis TaxID=1926277 RepID=UPI00098867D8|nr:MarR family transcriptional regulator [Sediminibacillus massiliensis]